MTPITAPVPVAVAAPTVAAAPEPEAAAMILPIGVSVPGEKHLLASRKHPQDESGQGVAGDLVTGGAGLSLAGLSIREHGNPPDPTKSTQNRTNSRANFRLSESTHSLKFEQQRLF